MSLSNPLLNLSKLVVITIDCGSKFHKSIQHGLKKYFLWSVQKKEVRSAIRHFFRQRFSPVPPAVEIGQGNNFTLLEK